MKRNLLLILTIFMIIGISIYSLYNYNKSVDIEKILETSSYAYLSSNAKDYIRNYYNETGDILLTEKNKVKGKEYLNPDYIEYLDNQTDINQGYIPSVFTYDYNYVQTATNIENLPRQHDSRNYNGQNYVTPTKRQYGELCWDYAFTSVIETKLLKEGLKTNAQSLDLSERMMDYATSIPISVIDIEKNPYYGNYALNNLANSGNEYRYSTVLVNGLFPINESDWKYDTEYMGKVKPEDLYDHNKINYQVNEVKYLKDNNHNIGYDENTINLLKQYILEHGSIGLSLRVGAGKNFVRYLATEEEPMNSDSQYNYLYYKAANAQYQSNDHMVSIIGWDDDYTHNICVAENGELEDAINNNGTYRCNNGTLKTITGAWTTKDSANSSYHHVAYETVNSTYFVVTDISERDWDNVYSSTNEDGYSINNYIYTFNKQNNQEKINSIKFYSQSSSLNLNFYINTHDGKGEKLLASFKTTEAGMYTIPITDEFILSSDKFDVRVSPNVHFSVFTTNIDENKYIKLNDTKMVNSFNYLSLLENYKNVILISGISRNVNNEDISYVIKNKAGVDVSSSFNIARNYSVGNYINTIMRFDSNIPLGEYTGYAYIDNTLYSTFKINIDNYMEVVSGDGSEESPFIITNPRQLDMIRLNKYNYYKLGNDIDLTYDTQNENGLFYNDGKGWEPIAYSECRSDSVTKAYCTSGFSGIFDGNNYKIKGLYINRPDEDVVGLFQNTYNDNYSGLNFSNINMEDVDITGRNFVGALIGYAYGTTYERTLVFENVSVTGNVKGNNYVGGAIGYFKGGTGLTNYLIPNTKCKKRHCLDNMFSSATVEGNDYVGGIIGLLETQNYYNPNNANWRSTIDAYNWQSNGTIISKNNGSGFIGEVAIFNGNTVTLNNSITTAKVKASSDVAVVNDVSCTNSDDTYPNCGLVLNNIYYTNADGYKNNSLISANNTTKYSITDLTNENIYNSFGDFSTYYKKETIDNVQRIPFLKNANITYTKANNINVNSLQSISLYDYIDGSNNITYSIADQSIATIDNNGIIKPLKNGTTTIRITSYYDGYDKNINLTIDLSNYEYTISYNLNGGTANNPTVYTQKTDTFTLINPTKKGHKFIGWTGSNGTTPQLEVSIVKGTTGNLQYTANWEPLSYKVTFNSNGGSGTMTTQDFVYDVSQKLKKNTYTKEGFKFKSWNTKQDGSGTPYSDEQTITIEQDLILYAEWEETYSYIINKYSKDEINKQIDKIDINTTIDDYKKNIELNVGYTIDVSYKTIDNKNVLYTGSKTKIYNNGKLIIEYTNIIRGEVNGDGKINYLDYVNVYNHIQKVKHPESTKQELENEFLISADLSDDDKVNYLDYVQIYNKIKELKTS